MKFKLLICGAAMAATTFSHAADYSAHAYSRATAKYGSATVDVTDSNSQSQYDASVETSSALPAITTGLTGVKASSSSSASSTELTTTSNIQWNRKNIPAPGVLEQGQASATSNAQDAKTYAYGGKVRFVLNYELATVGIGSSASFNFYANVNQYVEDSPYEWDRIDTEYVSFSDSLTNASGQASKVGVWTSDWYDFSSASKLAEVWWWNTQSFSYSIHASSSAGISNKVSGDYTGLAKVQFGYEVAPVPEPETYALILAGLGLVGATARRRAGRA